MKEKLKEAIAVLGLVGAGAVMLAVILVNHLARRWWMKAATSIAERIKEYAP